MPAFRACRVDSPNEPTSWASARREGADRLLTPGGLRLQALLQLLENRGIFEGRHVLGDFSPLAIGAQPAHDLAGTGLGQVVAETDVLRFWRSPDLLPTQSRSSLASFAALSLSAGRAPFKATNADTASPVVSSDARPPPLATSGLQPRRFDLHGAEAMAGHVQYVVDTTGDAEVAMRTASRTAPSPARWVTFEFIREVGTS